MALVFFNSKNFEILAFLDPFWISHLSNLKQSRIVDEFIISFEHLNFRIEGMLDAFFWQ
jgi:hypothetical protein